MVHDVVDECNHFATRAEQGRSTAQAAGLPHRGIGDDMKRLGLRRTSVVTLAVAGLLVATTPAMAGPGKPDVVERYDFVDEEHRDDFLSDVCGIEVYVSGEGKGTFKAYPDGSITDHFNTRFVFTSPDTGETLIRTDAATFRGQGEEVVDAEAETVTITFRDEYYGLPAKWSKPGEGTLLRDAGIAIFDGTVVLDVSGDEPVPIFFDETITTKGPHPELLETDVLAFICSSLGA